MYAYVWYAVYVYMWIQVYAGVFPCLCMCNGVHARGSLWNLSLCRLTFLKPGSHLEFTILTNLDPVNTHSLFSMNPYPMPSDGFQTFACPVMDSRHLPLGKFD